MRVRLPQSAEWKGTRFFLMILFRRPSLANAVVCLCLSISSAAMAQQAQQPATPPPAQPAQPRPPNPFETIPQQPEAPKPDTPQAAPQTPQQPGRPALEQPKPAEEPKPEPGMENAVESIEFRGSRRVPQDTLRAMMVTKRGDKYDPESLRRDFMAFWNTGRFDDITLETERGKVGL